MDAQSQGYGGFAVAGWRSKGVKSAALDKAFDSICWGSVAIDELFSCDECRLLLGAIRICGWDLGLDLSDWSAWLVA
jgi:hypothetical protein